MRGSLIVRLLAKVEVRDDGCWVFTGYRLQSGYGLIGLGAASLGLDYTHRVAYRELVGPIPPGLDLDHLCRNRGCCNPMHLEPVTRRENLMRGDTHTARNAAKTHCKRGHEFTVENTRFDGKGRQCRICDRIRRGSKVVAAA